MSTEDRLRRALAQQAAGHEPSADALDRIEEKIMEQQRFSTTQQWVLGGISVAAALVLVIVVAANLGGDDGDTDVATNTTVASTVVTEPPSTTPTTASTTTRPQPVVDPFGVAFPSPTDSRRFDSPETAARAFATDILGFTRLQVGEFQQGDSRSGEIPISDRVDGPVTTVLVRQMEDDTWFVLGSVTDSITVDAPATDDALATPFATNGRALAFEGTVDVVVLRQGQPSPLGSGFVTGSGTPPAGPFDGRIFYTATSADAPGLLVYRTLSAEDGHVEQATTVRVVLTSEMLPTPPDECGDVADDPDGSTADQRVVKVFFHCSLTGEVVAMRRTVPADDPAILRRSLEHLIAGPTDAELDAGFRSVFQDVSASIDELIITDGRALLDLGGNTDTMVPSTSTAIEQFRAEVFRTATQYSTVTEVEILFGGDCDRYARWAQTDTCVITGI